MLSLPRFLALSLALLAGLLLAGLGAQAWLRQEEQRVRATAQAELADRLRAAAAVTADAFAGWPPARLERVRQLAGAEVRVVEAGGLVVLEDGTQLEADPPLPATRRFLFLYQRVLLALGLLAGLLTLILVVTAALRRPASETGSTRAPFSQQRRDVLSLAHLAQTSVQQQAELDRERDERLRAEAEARVRLQLLNRALEEKIRIGRDLHDGVIQTLYAAGLTLQSAQPLTTTNPAEAGRRIDSTLDLLNRTIAEVRGYISGLSPLSVRGSSITGVLSKVVDELRAERPVTCDLQVDESAATALSDEQLGDTLQIAREAISNALRHGEAHHLMVKLQAGDDGVHLHVQDNGRGFDPAAPGRTGHGLANMRARAEHGGGRLVIDSAPAQGTRLWLLWPDARHS